jgi:hypothetical protein
MVFPKWLNGVSEQHVKTRIGICPLDTSLQMLEDSIDHHRNHQIKPEFNIVAGANPTLSAYMEIAAAYRAGHSLRRIAKLYGVSY